MDKSTIGGFEASDTNRVIGSDEWDISAFASYHQKSNILAENSQQDTLNKENFFDRLQ